jgi:hypothetical protein
MLLRQVGVVGILMVAAIAEAQSPVPNANFSVIAAKIICR